MAQPITIPFVGPKVESLLLWKDIKTSAAVFVGITVAYSVIGLSAAGPLAMTLRILALAALVALVWSVGAGFFGRAGPPVPSILSTGLTEADWNNTTSSALPHINKGLTFLGTVASGKSPKLSIQVILGSFVASYVLACVPVLGLAYTVVLLAFTVPKLYELRKDDADKLIAQGQSKYNELYAKFDDAVLKKISKASPKKEQ